MKFKKYNCALLCSIVCFTISSASFILIPISDFNGTKIERILAYMVGILVWNCQEMCSRGIPKIMDRQESGGVMRELL